MGEFIQDGTGTSNSAKVDNTFRLETRSVSEIGEVEASKGEFAYFLVTSLITLTNAAESDLLWFKNNEDFDALIATLFVHSKASASGTGNVYTVGLYDGVTALSSSSAITSVNFNFGSSSTLTGTYEEGVQGSAFTGGTQVGSFLPRIETPFEETLNITLKKGSSIGVSVTPPASNTSFPVLIGLKTHLIKNI